MTGLELIMVSKDFSGVHAVRAVTLSVQPGQVVGLVGPNGSGKTTVINLATGTLAPSAGRVQVDGVDLTGSSSPRFARAGVLRTFQSIRLFEALSALDNVMVGAQRGCRLSLFGAMARPPGFRRRENRWRSEALTALDELGIADLADSPVSVLSQGQRRAVELARVLAARPAYLMLDEPAAGVDGTRLAALGDAVHACRTAGTGVLLVEHDTGLVAALADEVVGMVDGTVIARGDFATVAAQPELAAHMGDR